MTPEHQIGNWNSAIRARDVNIEAREGKLLAA